MATSSADPSITAFLPYHSFDPEEKVFLQRTGSLGVIWKIGQIPAEATPPEALSGLCSSLAHMFGRIPPGFTVQILYQSTRNLRGRLINWDQAGRDDGIYRPLTSARSNHLQHLSLETEHGTYSSRSIDVYLALKKDIPWKSPAFATRMKAFLTGRELVRTFVYDRYKKEKAAFLDVVRQVEASLKQVKLGQERIDPPGLFALLNPIVSPRRAASTTEPPMDNPRMLISDQVAPAELTANFIDGQITVDGFHHRVLSMREVPLQTFTGMLSLDGNNRAVLDAAPEMFVSFNINTLDQQQVKRSLNGKKRLAFAALGTKDGQVEGSATREEIDSVLGAMFREGESVLSARICFIVREAKEEDLNRRVKDVQAALSTVGVELLEETELAPSLFLQALPFCHLPETDEGIKRNRRLLAGNLVDMLPVFGAYPGTRTPDMLLLNRRGEPAHFSFFDNEVAPHAIVSGVTGSGKSVWAQNLLLSAIRRGARAFIVDRGNSYKKLTELVGGSYLPFDLANPISINPFDREPTAESLEFLAYLVAELVTHGNRDATETELGLIVRAINEAYIGSKNQGKTCDLEAVRQTLAALSAQDKCGGDMAIALELYVGRGPYAGFFLGKNQLDLEKDIVVFELGELATRKVIASPILMALIHNVTRYCMTDMKRDKYLLVDEAWTLLKTENTSRFLENVFRTYRKYRTAAVMLTQQVADFNGDIGTAIRANAPNRILLKQTQETIMSMEKLLDLNPMQKALIQGVRSVKGDYSEAFYSTGSGEGVLRLIQDPFTYWLTTTDPADNATLADLIQKYEAKGASQPKVSALMAASLRTKLEGQTEHLTARDAALLKAAGVLREEL